MIRCRLVPLLLALIAVAGCRPGRVANTPAGTDANFKVYKVRGTVVSTDPAKGEVTLDHGAIPGYMDAMTMPYKLKNPNIAGELHPGDVLNADLLVPNDPNGNALLDEIDVIAQGKPDYRPKVIYHVPAPGDRVPDFRLRDQDGRAIHLAQFKGKALLITFIYTRCPLPDFCPRVTRNFAVVERQLSATPVLLNKTQLLCISFDPQNDTPARLKAYGETYIGNDSKDAFAHWDFAVPSAAALKEMAQYFNVGLTNEADGTITHTLSTTLIGPDGRVVRFYPGNDWTAEQVLADVKESAASAG
ncbi:MAG TPA: SCO family protein [Terracidiphilus sp.]|nr:SCO family protein [Terracidiphilus sp.]